MSIETYGDPRTAIVRDKYFSLRPKPLERWLWAAKAPGSAERVFWYHWNIGHQNGSWVSQVPLRIVAKECGLDVATVTRAYQWLKGRGLIRRVDPGRDEAKPFSQATALTEVFVPRELVKRLAAEPNRRRREGRAQAPSTARPTAPMPNRPSASPVPALAATAAPALSRRESQAIFQKLTAGERGRFAEASRERRTGIDFDADGRLSGEERVHVLHTLALVANARPESAPPTTSRTVSRGPKARLSALQLADARAQIVKAKGEGDDRDVNALLREVVWSVEEGSLARFEPRHAFAIACKKIREGAWSTPFRMPVDWSWKRALPELCSGAGQY